MALQISSHVDQLLGSMSLEEKVGQTFVFTFTSMPQALNDLKWQPGGYIRIFSDVFTLTRQHAELRARTRIPLLIAADCERGLGTMIAGGSELCTMMCLGATGSEDLAYRVGKAFAEETAAVGINMNYVPVMDVNVNEDNPIINTRSFGGDSALVARLGAAFIRGHKAGGTLTCAKHFPGHGDTDVDSHTSLSSINADRRRLDAVELPPFRAAIEAGVDAMMSAHLLIPALEPENLPATLSRRILTDFLRGELGFTGVTFTDALEMGAISRNFSPKEGIVRAMNAGCDMLIMPTDNARSFNLLLDAVKSGEVAESRLDEAVARILTMKEKGGLFDAAVPDVSELQQHVATRETRALALEVSLAGTTLVQQAGKALPIAPGAKVTCITLSNHEDGRAYYMEPRTFGAHLQARIENTRHVHCGKLLEEHPHEFGTADRALELAADSDVVVVGAYIRVVVNRGNVGLGERTEAFLQRLKEVGKPVVVVSFGSPYLAKTVPWAAAFVCAYGASDANQEATARLLAGEAEFQGTLPVAVTL